MMGPRLPVCYFFSNIYPGATGMGIRGDLRKSGLCCLDT